MRYRLAVLAAALLFSTGGVAIKMTDLSSWQVAGLRSLVAAVVLLVALPESRRLADPRTWLAGGVYAATLVLFVLATKLTTSANAIFLQATAPIWLLGLGPLMLGEKPNRRDGWLAAVLMLGMICSMLDRSIVSTLAPHPRLGNALATASGLTWAFTIVALRSASSREGSSSLPVAAAGNLLAFAGTVPLMLPLGPVSLADVLTLLYLGAFQVGLAYVLLNQAVRRVPALEAALLILVEPAMNPVWTWLVLGECPGQLTLLGGLLILLGTLAHALATPRSAAAAAETMPPD